MESIDLSVSIAGLQLKNPMMTASGTSGCGPEFAQYIDLKCLGAFVTKAVTPEVRKGKVLNLRRQITEGTYDARDHLDAALDRVLEDFMTQ